MRARCKAEVAELGRRKSEHATRKVEVRVVRPAKNGKKPERRGMCVGRLLAVPRCGTSHVPNSQPKEGQHEQRLNRIHSDLAFRLASSVICAHELNKPQTRQHAHTRPHTTRAHHPLARDRSLQLLLSCAPRTQPAFAAIQAGCTISGRSSLCAARSRLRRPIRTWRGEAHAHRALRRARPRSRVCCRMARPGATTSSCPPRAGCVGVATARPRISPFPAEWTLAGCRAAIVAGR